MKSVLLTIAVMTLTLGCSGKTETPAESETPAATAAQQSDAQPPVSSPSTATAPATTAASADGVQSFDILVSGGEYQPASVTVTKGKPVRLNFRRDEKPTCGDTVIFPSLNIKKEIPRDAVTTVEFTPDKAGDIAFTCGMNMFKGTVVVQ